MATRSKKNVSPTDFAFGCFNFKIKEDSVENIKALTGSKEDFLFGAIDNNSQIIVINKDISPQTKRETLLHEIVHAIVFNNNIGSIDNAEDMENVVDRTAAGVYEVIKRNPDIVKWIMEA